MAAHSSCQLKVAGDGSTAPAVPAQPKRLLVIDLNLGRHGHPSIPQANLAVELMGNKTGAYEAVSSTDRAMLQPDDLRQFDAVFLNDTIGPIFDIPETRASFRDFISNGGVLSACRGEIRGKYDHRQFLGYGVRRGLVCVRWCHQ